MKTRLEPSGSEHQEQDREKVQETFLDIPYDDEFLGYEAFHVVGYETIDPLDTVSIMT